MSSSSSRRNSQSMSGSDSGGGSRPKFVLNDIKAILVDNEKINEPLINRVQIKKDLDTDEKLSKEAAKKMEEDATAPSEREGMKMDYVQTHTCAHFHTAPEKILMFVCKCCVDKMGCLAAQDEEDGHRGGGGGAEQLMRVDNQTQSWPKQEKKPDVVRPIVVVEEELSKAAPKMIPEKFVTPEKEVKIESEAKKVAEDESTLAKEALMRVCVEKDKSTAPRPTEPKRTLKAAVTKLLEPKKLPERPRQKPAPPRPVTPPIVRKYKPLPDKECSGMSMLEVRLAMDTLVAKIEHDKLMKEWNAFVQNENKKDMVIIQMRRAILRERQEMK